MFLSKLSKKFLIVLMVLFLSATNLNFVQAQTESGADKISFADEIIKLTNEQRTINGSGGLKKNDQLMKAAQLKAEDMAAKGYFAHTSPAGITPWQWFYKVGYKPVMAGENLALAYSETTKIIDSWMASPTHKKNLVNKEFREIGIGVAKGMYKGEEMIFVVQEFGVSVK